VWLVLGSAPDFEGPQAGEPGSDGAVAVTATADAGNAATHVSTTARMAPGLAMRESSHEVAARYFSSPEVLPSSWRDTISS
jgi:hypothetical protein